MIPTARRRAVRRAALEASGFTIIDKDGAGQVTHPSWPGIMTIAEAVVLARAGLPSRPPSMKLAMTWRELHGSTPDPDDFADPDTGRPSEEASDGLP